MTEAVTDTSATNAPTVESTPSAEAVAPPLPAEVEGADSTAAAETEPVVEEKVDPPKPTNLERAKAAAERLKAERRERASLVEQQRRSQWELQQHQQALTAERAERERLSRIAAEYEAVKADPMAFFEKAGVPAGKLVEQQLREQTPEARLEKLEREYNARLEAAVSKIQRDSEEREQQAAQARQMETAKTRFLATAADDTKFPTIARLTAVRPESVIREALEIHQMARAQGYQYSDAEVLEHLESTYASIYSPPAPKTGQTKSQTAQAATEKSASGAPKTAGSPRTLSSDMNAEKASLPANFDEMDDKTQRRAMAEWLERQARGE